ncbi:MAG: hypothetical protein J6X55_00115 [Victivallales bacterium]|nr:hypothetical protein [Victivallales bacterium]
MPKKLTVHVILNSHLDPIWLWGYGNGIDEVVATARSACDLLDDYPEIHITRGEAWFYEMLEMHDPITFKRVQEHVRNGHWHIVGGWYVQPDCNLASPETYAMHAKISGKYFKQKFGIEQCETGYNVDSFGHGAYLPDFYTAAGMTNYLFMRPGEHEKSLRGNLFRWRSPNGNELLASRIFPSYSSNPNSVLKLLQMHIDSADRSVGHSCFFCGVGDHGAGPSRKEIAILKEHWNDWEKDNVELIFSHPDAYFNALRPHLEKLPVVEGELQFHAIGCYTATTEIKRSIRATENMLIEFGHLLKPAERENCWKRVLFATFHDVLAGSSISSAMSFIYDSLAFVRATVAEARLRASRKESLSLPPADRQRIVLSNQGGRPYRGLFSVEPWVSVQCDYGKHAPNAIQFHDEKGQIVLTQAIPPECIVGGRAAQLFDIAIPAHSSRVISFSYNESPQKSRPFTSRDINLKVLPALQYEGKVFFEAPYYELYNDSTDTWSHRVPSFPTENPIAVAKTTAHSSTIFNGPIAIQKQFKATLRNVSTIENNITISKGLNGIHCQVTVLSSIGPRKILKMCLKPAFKVVKRLDGVSGGMLERQCDGREYPVFNVIQLHGENGETATIISKDVFACDVQPDGTVRLTLLRTPYAAHHDPTAVPQNNARHALDQRLMTYDITLLCNASRSQIQDEIYRQKNPLIVSETTYGMNRES